MDIVTFALAKSKTVRQPLRADTHFLLRASLSLHKKNRISDIYILLESLMRTIRLFLFMITICMTLSSCELLCLFLDEAIDSKNEQKKKKKKKTKKQKTVENLNTAYPTL